MRELERAREAGASLGGAAGAPASASAPASSAPVSSATPDATEPPRVAPSTSVPDESARSSDGSTPAPRSARAADVPPAPASTSAPSSVSAPSSAHAPGSVAEPGQLSRRQLRALREAQQGGAGTPAPLQEPAPEPRRDLSEALQGVDTFVPPTGAARAEGAGDNPFEAVLPRVDERPSDGAPVGDATQDAEASGTASRDAASSVPEAPAPSAEPVRPGATDASGTPARTAAGTDAGAEQEPRPTSTPSVFPFALGGPQDATAPSASIVDDAAPADATDAPVRTGHWSQIVDEGPSTDTAPGRVVGPTTGQTNALILTDEQVADVTGALNATGEIIITGSIDLPKSLAATGSQAKIDTSDIDRLMEQGDAEAAETDAQPVRASRAVSTHTSTRAVVLSAAQPSSSKLPLILGISGGVVGLGIIAGVVVGFTTGLFG